jgi:parallel beta-helix repeat protein
MQLLLITLKCIVPSVLAFVILILLSFHISYADSDFSQCSMNITESDMPYAMDQNNTIYCLNQSVSILGDNATVFSAGVRNSTLDCMGYAIEGDSSDDTYGVFMGNGSLNNTIRNCNITLFNYNIYLEYTSGNRIYNTTVEYRRQGVVLLNSSGNLFQNVSSKMNSDGFFIENSYNNTFMNINSSINRNGFWQTQSYNNTIKDSYASWNQYSGFYAEFSHHILFQNDTAYNNDVGFLMETSNNITMDICNSNSVMTPYSGSHMWHSGAGQDINSSLSRTINLTGVNNATMTFWQWYNTEWGSDGGRLDFFNQTSSSWVTLYPEGDYYPPGDSNVTSLASEGYNDFSRTWNKATFNLTNLTGIPVMIRFYFKSDSYASYRNWFIDDINISQIGFFDDAESGSLWNSSVFSLVESSTAQSYGLVMQGSDSGGPVIENSEYGKIFFQEPVNLSTGIDSSNVNISFNRIEVNSTALPELNTSATLTFYNLTFNDPRILKDGAVCSDCSELSYENGTLVFNVTSFSVYTTEETPVEQPPQQGSVFVGGGGVVNISRTPDKNNTNQSLDEESNLADENQTLTCPACSEPTKWSSCAESRQERKIYECDDSAQECKERSEYRYCSMFKEGKTNDYSLLAAVSVAIISIILYAIMKSRKTTVKKRKKRKV